MAITSDDVKAAKPDAVMIYNQKTCAVTWMAAIRFKGDRHGSILTGRDYKKGKEFKTDEKAFAWAKKEINDRLIAMLKEEAKGQKKAKAS